MSMKKTTVIFAIFSVLVCSCEKYLDTTPSTSVTPEEYLQDETQAQSMLMGIYNLFYDGNRLSPYVFDMMTDNIYTSNVDLGVNEFAAGTQNSMSVWAELKWSADYKAISRANFLISQLNLNNTISDQSKAQLKAEAQFLRAYYYFDLVQFYGRVPLLDENTPKIDMPREEIAKVISFVKSDIEAGINGLASKKDSQRANVGAAWMLKMRVALYEKDYRTALECGHEIEKIGYTLYPSYSNLFLESGHDDPAQNEIIWKVNFDADQISNTVTSIIYSWRSFNVTLEMVDSYFTANGLPVKKIVASDGTEIPADPTYKPRAKSFENRDPRFYDSVLYPGQRYVLVATACDYDFNPRGWRAFTGFIPKKHCNEQLVNLSKDGSDRILMRYGEVLLSMAEAENEINGPAGAYQYLDQLRDRVGMISVSASLPGLSQAAMRELIRNERRVELFCEGQRWADIRRWGIAQDVMKDATGYDYTLLKYVEPMEQDWWKFKVVTVNKRSFNRDRDYLWPIPQVEINANSCLTNDQNPGY